VVAHDPLHRSGRAALPHPAPASGDNADGAQRCWTPGVCAPAHFARHYGTGSGSRFAGANSPWPVPFPPSPPPPVAQPCSETSQVLRDRPTSHARSSPACVLRLPGAACRRFPPQANMGSPGSRARCFRTCPGSLTARGRPHLALAMRTVLPSASSHDVGPAKVGSFAAH